jgi:ATP-dependent exoDNAse (exonuclease V) beta subunit
LTVIDWKTNRRQQGESEGEFLDRLDSTYRPQLSAYARAVTEALGGAKPTLLIYSTVAGKTIEMEDG